MRGTIGAALMAVFIVSVGCTDKTAEPTATVAADASDAAPQSTPSASSAPNTDWTIRSGAVGPIRVGDSLAATNTATGTTFTVHGFDDFERRCYSATTEEIEGVSLQVEATTPSADPLEGTIAVIYVSDERYRTDEDVGVGSTEADVQEAYPSIDVRPDEYSASHHVMTTSSDSIHFETDGSIVTSIQVGNYRVEGCA